MTTTTAKTLTWKELAEALGAPNDKAGRSRWAALGYITECSRCGGYGKYSYCQMYGDRCFGCSGTGKTYLAPTNKRVEEAKAKIAAGGLDAYFAENRRLREIRARMKSVRAAVHALYKIVGNAYEAAWRKGWTGTIEQRVAIPGWLFDLQDRANAIHWERLRDIETALEKGLGTVDDAAPFFDAALEAMREVVAEYEATVASIG
jgi:hypothetical protein